MTGLIVLIVCIWLIAKYIDKSGLKQKWKEEAEEKQRLLEEEQKKQLRENIELLKQGITLQEYFQIEDKLTANQMMNFYRNYGVHVIYNETKKLFMGASNHAIRVDIEMLFVRERERDTYLHYVEGDKFIIKFYEIENFETMDTLEQYKIMEKIDKDYYEPWGESYYDYSLRMYEEAKNKR